MKGWLKPTADKALGLGKDAALSKQTTAWSSLVFSKSKSTISEPSSMAEKRVAVFDSVVAPARSKVLPALPQRPDQAMLARPEVQALSVRHCKALANRLDRAAAVLDALARPTATREELHRLTSCTDLKPTTFPASAAMVKALSRGYEDRQVTGVCRSAEAHVEHGIKTLNLVHEAEELHREVASAVAGASTGAIAAAPTPLSVAAAELRQARTAVTTRLNTFSTAYRNFVEQDLGRTVTADMQDQIDRIADVRTAPKTRDGLHAALMARTVAGQRIDKALEAVTDVAERGALRDGISRLRQDPDRQRGDHAIIALVGELTGRTGLGATAGAAQFLRQMEAMKGAPLDETLRVHTGIYREAYQPARTEGGDDRLAAWQETRAKDMEKLHTELTSIALHVRQAERIGTLDARLATVFPPAADGSAAPEPAAIKAGIAASWDRLASRAPGEPVSAQDKLNIKLAKCILDHGPAVRDMAATLMDLQENYAAKLDRSPDMKKLLAAGSTGASYDPVEQRANARTRLDNLQMGIVDVMQAARQRYEAPTDVSREVIDKTIQDAQDIVDNPAGRDTVKVAALERHLFLMKNYVRETNSADAVELLTQLGDNDPRCGTDAVVAENLTAYGNGGLSFGANVGHGVRAFGGLDGAVAGQRPGPAMIVRNHVPNSIVLTESTAYSIKSICDLATTSYKGSIKAAFNAAYTASAHERAVVRSAMAFGGSEAAGFERVVIENTKPGLACMVHKAPVLDGTAKNDKLSNATYIGMNDAVNRALFQKVQAPDVAVIDSAMPGWNNLNHFFASTDRATLEPLVTKREVTITLSHQHAEAIGASFTGGTKAQEKNEHRGVFSGRVGVGFDAKYGHAYREEVIQTSTLDKVTISDAFSQTRAATATPGAIRLSGSAALDGGVSYAASLAADAALAAAKQVVAEGSPLLKPLQEAADQASQVNAAVPKLRYGTQVDLAKLTRGVEHARDYKEDYKRVVRDQFGNEIPALVRDSRTATDGRLLVNNIVNDVGLANATLAQRIDDGAMSAIEKQTLTKLLCLSTIASHYQNAGALGRGTDVPNDNLTINVTASLSPAAAARHAAVKAGFGRAPDADEGAHILANSLNYQTLGAAGGFKNQNTTTAINGAVARTKRSTSSAQSAGYPSGVDVIDEATARRFDTFLRRAENADIRTALETIGMSEPLQLLSDYRAVAHPDQPRIDATPESSRVPEGRAPRRRASDLESGLAYIEMETPRA